MHEKIKTLLVHKRPEPFRGLQLALEEQAIEVHSVKSCGEAALSLWSEQPPHLVFTDVQLPDGNWADVLTLSRKAPQPTNVIVVSPIVDIQFYIEALERGAFDFIVPPLTDVDLPHVVWIAADNVLSRRGTSAQNPPPCQPKLAGLGTAR
jgi:two-component system response regulator (stage 0 sporulation protein F)